MQKQYLLAERTIDDDDFHDLVGWIKTIMNFNKPFTFYYPGFNVRSTDLNARIGLSQLKKADRIEFICGTVLSVKAV